MTNRPKVHVFFGAPCPSLCASERDSNEDSSEWKTLELSWDQGRLRPRTDDRGVQVNPDSVEVNVSAGQVGRDVKKGHMGLPTTTEGHSLPLFEEDGEKVVAANSLESTPSSQCSQKKTPLKDDDDDLCPESLQGYLDRCFPLAQPLTISECQLSSSGMSLESEYLSVWTKSQALLMKRRPGLPPEPAPTGMGSPRTPTQTQQTPVISRTSPELYSPHSSPGSGQAEGGTLQGSLDKFSEILLSQRQQEGGVMLQRMPDGLLCTQGSPAAALAHNNKDRLLEEAQPAQTSPDRNSPVSPARKKSKLSPTTPKGQRSAWGGCITAGPPTLLARCKAHGVQYSILVIVVHPFHLQEVKMRTGAAAGSTIPLATLIVTDQSDVEMKVVMWRTAAFWVLTVQPGDVLLITGREGRTVLVRQDHFQSSSS